MESVTQRKLAWRLVGAVLLAFAASMAFTWIFHERMTRRAMQGLFDNKFDDVAVAIRERVDARMLRQAMAVRDKYYEMREADWWNDPDESSRRLRALAVDLGVDEICIADADGLLTHSARREEVGALNFRTADDQAREFAALLVDKSEVTQPPRRNTLRGEQVKYVGVWLPDGGFVQVGGGEKAVRELARTAVTGLTHGWHISGDGGGIYITTGNGTIISHPEAGREGGQWQNPGDDAYCVKRMIEGFPVYIVMPKCTAIVERRVLVATSAFLNGVALVLASILVGIVIARYVRRQMAARRQQEMAMAADIQESSIPRVFPPFADERRMDVFASMKTARDVGGDFYDFFVPSPGRFTFLVADVSGKGIPAALYMMRAMTTIKGIAQTGLPLAEAAERANAALSRDNDANMFVTVWIGELDLATGILTYVNAGHNPPILVSPGAKSSYVRNLSGLMFGAMPGMKYKSYELRLRPGDLIYLYTDGMTEQPDGKGELFGEARLVNSVDALVETGTAALGHGESPLLSALVAVVAAHAAGVEQADDCTQLIIRWNGNGCAPRPFPPTQEGIARASAYLDETMAGIDANAADGAPRFASLAPTLHIILDEIASNIVKHSGASGFELEIERTEDPPGVKLVFIEDGAPYDPLAHADPDTSLSATDRPIGGLGILMVKKMSDSVFYERVRNRNFLTVFKKIAVAGADVSKRTEG